MSTICKKEIRAYLTSMSGYVFIAFMLLVTGIYFTAYRMNMAYPIFGYTLSAVNFIFLIVTPILLPVVKALGMDPIHFGIVIMMNLAVGSLTPPVGTTLFAGCAVGDIPIEKATKALLPYYAVMVVALLLVTYIPAFSMTLPNLLMH